MRLPDTGGVVPPHSIEAEEAVLSSVLTASAGGDERALDECRGVGLTADDMYSDAHRRIYQAACDVADTHQPVDITTVAAKLHERERLQAAGGIAYLADLVDKTPSVAHVAAHALIVRDYAKRRAFLAALSKATTTAWTHRGSSTEMMADAMSALDVVVDDDARPLTLMFDAMAVRVAELGEQWAGRRAQFGMASVLPGLQPILGGYRLGSLVLLAGPTGGGKSSAGLQDVLGIAGTEYNGERIGAVFVSLEMPIEENVDRCLAIESGVPDSVLQTGQFASNDQSEAFDVGVDSVSRKPIWFYTSPVDIAEIRALYRKADREMREHGAGRRVRLLVVDYVGLVDLAEADRHDIALANLARGLKQLAMAESIVVIALCQYNRSAAARDPWDEPQLSDLKDSSGLEQNANQVIMVHRVDQAGAEDYAGLFVRKNRKGAKGVARCKFNGASYRFEPASDLDIERWKQARDSGGRRRKARR